VSMRAFVLALCLSLAFLTMVISALRKRALREQMAVLWIGLSAIFLLFCVSLPFHVLDHVAHFVGIKYGSDLLFLLGMLFLVVLVFQLSLGLARLSSKFTRLAQEFAILTANTPELDCASKDPDTLPARHDTDDRSKDQSAESSDG
jgi:hypothetical protein